VSRYH